MLLCVLLISATIVPISAANTSDSKITKFDLSYFYYREVSARSKTNTTPLYFYYTIGKHNVFRFRPWALLQQILALRTI